MSIAAEQLIAERGMKQAFGRIDAPDDTNDAVLKVAWEIS